MRFIGILVIGLSLLGQQQQQTGAGQAGTQVDPNVKLGRIAGKVLNAITGEPVRKATVTLQPAGAQGGQGGAPAGAGPQAQGGGAPARAISTGTDNTGAFVFENVNAGNYRLSGEKTGFIRTNFGGRSTGAIGSQLAVSSGSAIADVIVRITPQGIVSGRVLDEDGEPIEGVAVQLLAQRGGLCRGIVGPHAAIVGEHLGGESSGLLIEQVGARRRSAGDIRNA